MPQKTIHAGKAAKFKDSIDGIAADAVLTDAQRTSLQQALVDASETFGEINGSKTVTACYSASTTAVTVWVGVA